MLPSVSAAFFVARDKPCARFVAQGCRSVRQKSILRGRWSHAETEGVPAQAQRREGPFGGVVRDRSRAWAQSPHLLGCPAKEPSMGAPGSERRLAAVLAADMVGFSRLMEVDETGTLAR